MKLGLTLSNRCYVNGTHDGKERSIRDRDRKMTNDPRDSRREKKLIMGCRISIDIDERENEVRKKVYRKVLNEGKQKARKRLGNGVVVR